MNDSEGELEPVNYVLPNPWSLCVALSSLIGQAHGELRCERSGDAEQTLNDAMKMIGTFGLIATDRDQPPQN